ncbi:MAG: tRNA uridine-5-carboxymethylaminomethyl(34) synthesis GTPase MnmE [Bacteroidales bacterium]|nr:tRNA uridine-5-carboxymethylaminomethyl(34) synthesis GTPase MnmE [Bacteroidales bacterium]
MKDTTIAAIATPAGVGAIGVIRLSGNKAISICERIFKPKKKGLILSQQDPYTIHFGSLLDNDRIVDEVLVSLFKSPHSYTSEDVIEISCHGSTIIQQEIIELLIKNGAVPAQAGEFTLRAFLNGKMDLSQAEGVADLIASSSEVSRRVAIDQMRGGFSNELKTLREKLLHFISMIELELDFSEEDVEFADRTQLRELISDMLHQTIKLLESFKYGNVIKQGVPVAIVGKPNVGKSTLLNKILNEEKAIVSEIAGTTRDAIEDTITIKGINFRFIDTAGLRHTTDVIESIGIERAYEKISKAQVVLMMVDANDQPEKATDQIQNVIDSASNNQLIIILINKTDMADEAVLKIMEQSISKQFSGIEMLRLSAKHSTKIPQLLDMLAANFEPALSNSDAVIVTNARHFDSLYNAKENLERALNALDKQIPTDLLAMDIRQVLHYIGEITGEITTDEILGSIFSKFCVGK